MGFIEGSPALLSRSSRCDIQMGCKAHPADVSTGEGTFQKGSIREASWKRTPGGRLYTGGVGWPGEKGWERHLRGHRQHMPGCGHSPKASWGLRQCMRLRLQWALDLLGQLEMQIPSLHPRRLWFLRADRTQEPAFEQTSGLSPTPGASWSEKLGCRGIVGGGQGTVAGRGGRRGRNSALRGLGEAVLCFR